MQLYVEGTVNLRPEETAAVLVIRAWREPGMEPGGVRARLMQTPDTDVPGWELAAADGEDAIVTAVRDWLHTLPSER